MSDNLSILDTQNLTYKANQLNYEKTSKKVPKAVVMPNISVYLCVFEYGSSIIY